MIKLLVMSTLNMTEQEFEWYAGRVKDRAENLDPKKFIEQIKSGQRVVIEYPDKTITSYELIVDAKN